MEPQRRTLSETPYQGGVARPQRGTVVSVQVAVTPQKKITEDGHIILLGYMENAEVELVFKRDEAIRPLLTHLNQLINVTRSRHTSAGLPPPHASDLRCPLNVEGIWRVKLYFDQNDMPVRRYQLHAARWRVRRADGAEQIGGQRREASG
jgi:hypothetical protein